jgi:actin-like ATPase involved in cell morphogenesis
VDFEITRIEIPPVDELDRQLDDALEELDNDLKEVRNRDRRAGFARRSRRIETDYRKARGEPTCDNHYLYSLVGELRTLLIDVRGAHDLLTPPRSCICPKKGETTMSACGIDLGTTNSCIYIVDGDAGRLISDDLGNATFPSVVHAGGDGRRSVGHLARNHMGELPAPVVAVKRLMGTNETVLLGRERKTPVEVSALILAFLKELAESRTSGAIDRAVVTVPAYFSHIQRQQTDEAGRLAGFREVVTLLEPVAAALAYSLATEKETLRIFVYDLGGGTFDATVLEKDAHGGISVLAFGGDPFLGGEDVDARLARRLLSRLQERGYHLDLELDKPEDASRFQRLRFWAELAKRELSAKDEVSLIRQALFEDQNGETVDLDVTLSRRELEECAADLIERSMEASLATLDKAGIARDSFDEIVMVGGMSRMPLAQRRLAELFGRQPQVVDPDLIVARGAAIKAREIFGEQEVASSGLRLELRYPSRTDQSRVRIGGRFDRPLTGHTVYLLNDREERSQDLACSDRFTFEEVALAPESENLFTLAVEDAAAHPVLERQVKIVHDPACRPIVRSPGSVVTRPIQVRTLDGLSPLFLANTALPFTASCPFETADQSGSIVVPIWEDNHEVARLEIRDLPPGLKVGTPVVVDLEAHSDYRILATARIPDLDRSATVDFRIAPVDTTRLSPDVVRDELQALRETASQAGAECPAQEALAMFEVKLQGLTAEIEVELTEPQPNRARLHDKLGEVRALIDWLPAPEKEVRLEPPFDEFSELLTGLLTGAIKNGHPRLAEARALADTLREQARRAWEARDPIAWRRVNDQVPVIFEMLRPAPEEEVLSLAAWFLREQIPELEQAARGGQGRKIQALRSEVERCFLGMKSGTIDPRDAVARLARLYVEEIQPLRRQLGLTPAAAPQMSVPSGDGLLRQTTTGA